MSNKVPQIRFNGYSDAWEERKLGDEVRIVMGQSPNSENYTDDPNDYILVQGNADMKNGRVFPRVWTTQVTKQAEKDDLILSVRAPVGDIGKTAYDVVIGRGVAAIKGNEFIFQNLGKMKSDGYWTRYSTGSTFESINSTDIKEAIISVPAIEEQNKIGSFFKQLDNTIALHQRKLDLLKEQKKGYLQKMFPKNGARVPELRFAGFADAWEERKLNEVAIFYNGQRIPIDSSLRKQGEYPYYGATGIIDYVEDYIFDGEFVLLAEDGANITMRNSPIAYLTQGKFWLNNHAHIMAMKDGSNNFLVQLLEKQNYEKYNSGTAQPKLNSQVVKSLNFLFPTKEEQKKIGSFFKQLDNTIALHQRKLELLKEQKKGFLQKMFV